MTFAWYKKTLDETLIFDWYRKPTFSGRFLNYFSWHPLCQKIGTIIGLIDRVLLLSHPSFHKKNFDLVIKILLNNGYPLSLIFSTITKRLYKKFDPFNCADNLLLINNWQPKKISIIKNFSVYHLFLIFSQKSVCSLKMYHFYVWLTEALINLTDSLKFRKTFCLVLLNLMLFIRLIVRIVMHLMLGRQVS